ncbi:sushi domain-containing protein 3 [Spea bombifrons]|uniref:sushi domain-containing protein 3 n=1 Tax=Spea bombifrons TaxID=233779 RepID=UPI00234BF343|nr:sushi domain-containing protein 3 [Spea bombifrons]
MQPATASVLDLSRITEGRETPGQCRQVVPPESGSFHVLHGNGTSVGSVVGFQCSPMHQLVGEGTTTCVWRGNGAAWTTGTPTCKTLLKSDALGFKVAVIASIVSCAVILLMSMAFLICCLVKCMKRNERKRSQREKVVWHQIDCEELENMKGRNNNNNAERRRPALDDWLNMVYENRGFCRGHEARAGSSLTAGCTDGNRACFPDKQISGQHFAPGRHVSVQTVSGVHVVEVYGRDQDIHRRYE